MRLHVRARAIAAALSALLGAGCVSPVHVEHHDYPAGWPALRARHGDCGDLTGAYSNAGTGPASSPATSLTWYLVRKDYRHAAASRVVIEGPVGDTLEVRAGNDGAGGVTRVLRRGADFDCADGWVSVRTIGPALGGTVSASVWGDLAKADDGSLVVRHREEGGGFVPIPIYGSFRYWRRFLPAGNP